MTSLSVIAQPYAKASFEYALAHNELTIWSEWLSTASEIINNTQAAHYLLNPTIPGQKKLAFLVAIFENTYKKSTYNFTALLIENRRLHLLPTISNLFEIYRADFEKTIIVCVESYLPLKKDYQQQLITSLEKRFNKKVLLHCSINRNVLGGAIIYAGDQVIDSSVRGKLARLKTSLLTE